MSSKNKKHHGKAAEPRPMSQEKRAEERYAHACRSASQKVERIEENLTRAWERVDALQKNLQDAQMELIKTIVTMAPNINRCKQIKQKQGVDIKDIPRDELYDAMIRDTEIAGNAMGP